MGDKPLPLQQISAFEAALRHRSFSRAARELNVQQPAVSRQVAALEASLGVRLFVRTKPRLKLTANGEVLAEAVAKGFDALRKGICDLQDRQRPSAIVVNAAIGFTSFYLLPRLAEFQSRHPEVQVQVVTRDQNPDYDALECDAVVLFGDRGLEDLPTRKLFPERMVAVCRKDYLGGSRLDLAALSQARLLYMASHEHAADWDRFFAGSGISVPAPPRHDRILSFMVYLRAIHNGLGIGIGWRPMIDEYLASEAVVLACDIHRQTNRGYYCSLTPRGVARPETALFLEWIGASAAEPRPGRIPG